MMYKSTIIAFACAMAVCTVQAQTGIAWDTVLDCNAAGEGAWRPRIALNGSGHPVVLWADNTPVRNLVAIGNGTSFSTPVEVNQGFVPAVADWMGSSIAATGNTVWVVMKANPEETMPVYVRRSDDGGTTWGDTLRVDPFDGKVSRFPSIDVTDPDAPLVQYMQFDSGYYGARQVVCHVMGGAFMPPVQVSQPYAPGDVCDCCPNQVVADGSRVVALYRNAGPNLRVMWGAASANGGMTFPTGELLDYTAWPLNACPSSGPDGYFDGDSIRYVWMSGATNGSKVYIGSALADDLATGGQHNVHPDQPQNQQQNFPRIAGNGDTLAVVWQQQQSGQTEILFSWSVTGVSGLSEPDTVNVDLAGAQKTPDIAYADGTFHIVWSEPSTGQVRYRSAQLVNMVGVAEGSSVELVRATPNPARDHVSVSGGPWGVATIIDERGAVVARRSVLNGRVDLDGLAAGMYTLKLVGHGNMNATAKLSVAP